MTRYRKTADSRNPGNSGETNMFDIHRVQHIANRRGYYELVVYLEGHRKEYVNFILTGRATKCADFHIRLAFSGELSDRWWAIQETRRSRLCVSITM